MSHGPAPHQRRLPDLSLTCNTVANYGNTGTSVAGCYSNATHPLTIDILESNFMLSPRAACSRAVR